MLSQETTRPDIWTGTVPAFEDPRLFLDRGAEWSPDSLESQIPSKQLPASCSLLNPKSLNARTSAFKIAQHDLFFCESFALHGD